MRAFFIATAAYFGLVFAVGFVLGTFRVLLLVPAVGERTAELIETPFMITAIILSARFVSRRFLRSSGPGLRLGVGFAALLLMLAIEVTVVLQLRGRTVGDELSDRDPLTGAVYVASLVFFALAPALVERRIRR